jgi:hypothetical protein
MTINGLQVALRDGQTAFYPNNRIEGIVMFDVLKETNIKSVQVKLSGKAKTLWFQIDLHLRHINDTVQEHWKRRHA